MVPFNFSFFRNFHSAQAGETTVCVCVCFSSQHSCQVCFTIYSYWFPCLNVRHCCLLTDQIRYIEPSVMPPPSLSFYHSNCELLILDFISHLTVKLKIHIELTISLQLTFSVSTLMNSCIWQIWRTRSDESSKPKLPPAACGAPSLWEVDEA